MAADTPTGQQPADDGAAIGFHFGYDRAWEQGGVTTQTAYKSYGLDPIGHFAWRTARSTTNKTKPEYPNSATLAVPSTPAEARP